jgi:predicted CopG family antitoxin
MATTTITIDVEVRDELRARGRMGESYNDVIRRLLGATRSKDSSHGEFPSRSADIPSKGWVPHQDRR